MTEADQNIYEFQKLSQLIRQVVQIGVIKNVNYTKGTAQVQFDTNYISDWLPWMEKLAGASHTWTPPKAGDQAVVICVSGNLKRGIIIGFLNQSKYPQISTDGNEHKVKFANNTEISVHETNNTMTVKCTGDLTIQGTTAVNITGASGDVVVNGISLTKHTHTQGGGDHFGAGGTTSAPN